jgi:ATP-dependent protease HslVU (ClpYQ) peptidase subunit
MTCILAVYDSAEGIMYLAGDTLTTTVNMSTMVDTKIVKHNKFLVGCAGTRSAQNYMESRLSKLEPNQALNTDLVGRIYSSWPRDLSLYPIEYVKGLDGEFLLVDNSNIFYMGTIVGYYQTQKHFMAIGSGAPVAIGAYDALSHVPGLSTIEIINRTFQTVARNCASVNDNVKLLTLR